jgi:hypothetical protein
MGVTRSSHFSRRCVIKPGDPYPLGFLEVGGVFRLDFGVFLDVVEYAPYSGT